MSIPNPKSAAELLALPVWEPFKAIVMMNAEDVSKWQPMVDFKLKMGHTLQVRQLPGFEPNPVDGDTVMFARDEYGFIWTQAGSYRVPWP